MTYKKTKRNFYNSAINMVMSVLALFIQINHNNLLMEIFGPEYLNDQIHALKLLYAILILQFLTSLYVLIRSSFILYEYKQGIRSEEDEAL